MSDSRHITDVEPRPLAGRSSSWFTTVLAAITLALVCLAANAPRASAASSAPTTGCADTAVTKNDSSHFPMVRLQLVRCDDGTGTLPHLRITENGQHVNSVKAYSGPIGSYEADPRPVIILAIDASDSMASPKIDQAKAAALQLIGLAGKDDRIGLVVFGARSWKVVKPTSDFASLKGEIAAISLTHGTSLYDGLKDAVDWFPADASQRTVVVLSDGADTSSKASIKSVLAAAHRQNVTIDAVGIAGAGFSPAALQSVTDGSSGTFDSVTDASQLTTVYQDLGQRLLRSWWVEYRSNQPGEAQVKIEVTPDGSTTSVSSYVAPAFHTPKGQVSFGTPKIAKESKPLLHLGGRLGVLLAALPFALLFGFLGFALFHGRGQVTLAQRIAPYTEPKPERQVVAQSGASGRARFAPLLKATEGLLNGSKLFARFRFLLQQANLPLREVELLYVMFGSSAGWFLAGLLFFQNLLFAALFAVFGLWLPYGYVKFKALRRKKRFEGQLADVLGTVAASLKAGHSFNQSLQSVAKEAPAPTGDEIQRVMAEARLGLPIEEALDAMARRMDSADFEFAVTAVNIQRTVGGSLSEILDMVADTVRGRQQFRKKVKALTSMGTMSAYVLLAMPIFMALLLSLLNATYMKPLFYSYPGHVMLVGGCIMMVFGYMACMKIVRIKI